MFFRRPSAMISMAALALFALAQTQSAQAGTGGQGMCLSPAGSNTAYVSPLDETYATSLGIFDRTNVSVTAFSPCLALPSAGNTAIEPFDATVSFDLSINGGTASHVIVTNVPVTVAVSNAGTAGNVTRYDTEVTQLDVVVPGGGLFRESPVLHSTGVTTVTDAGGGLFQISSFFNIYTDFSLDGGQSWVAGTLSGLEAGPSAVSMTLADVPEPMTMSVIGSALLGLGFVRRGR